MSALETEEARPGIFSSPRDPLASALQSYLAEQAHADPRALQPVIGAPDDVLEVKYDEHDMLGWIGSFFTWWHKISPHPFVDATAPPDRLKNAARIALLSDWGTGLYGAPVCAQSIARTAPPFDVVMHLGDVYYSGTDGEQTDRCLKYWPAVPNAINRAANANHDMYTGGHGYFNLVLAKFGQQASFCALQNDYWTLAILDTAYVDDEIHGNQVAWLDALIQDGGNRKVILFSHHQPYSQLDSQGPKLVAALAEFLANRKIFAWYWGHEHRCVLYDAHPTWGVLGRCIGHGGYPYFRDKVADLPVEAPGKSFHRLAPKNLVPGAIILDAPNPYIEGHENEYGAHGYVTLEFADAHLNEVIHAPDGTIVWQRALA